MNLRSLMPIGRDRKMARREFAPFDTLQREVDRVFDEFTRGWPGFALPMGLTRVFSVSGSNEAA